MPDWLTLAHSYAELFLPLRKFPHAAVQVTTYSTLGADFSKGQGKGADKQPPPQVNGNNNNKFPPLGSIKWHRLVLDEVRQLWQSAGRSLLP